jgi:hypothetical protein
MTVFAQVFGFALAIGVAASVFLLLLVGGFSLQGLTTWRAFADFGGLLILAVLPVSLPMLLIGAWRAARVTSREQTRRPLRFWLSRASAAGFLLAAIGGAIWYGGVNAGYIWNASWDAAPPGWIGPDRAGMLSFVLGMACVSGLAGAAVGATVGVFCWHVTRGLPPNKALQLTKPAQAMELRS